MPIVRPFRAIRPAPDKVHLVVSRSYITYDDGALSEKLESNPYSFIHVINPDHGHEITASHGTHDFFEKVREKYLDFYHNGYFVQDEVPQFYVYRQIAGDREFLGIICATASSDYAEDKIRKHENTLTKREQMFTDYLSVTGINAEPVLLTYPHVDRITEILKEATQVKAIYDFTTSDKFRHTMWGISDAMLVSELQERFQEVEAFYIADGHHRCASSARLTAQLNCGDYGNSAPHDYFMSFLVPDDAMHIEAFHRVLRLEGDVNKEAVLDQLSTKSTIEKIEAATLPSKHGEMVLFLQGDWYRLTTSHEFEGKLDVEFCYDLILKPLFGIEDERNDKRITFLSGNRGLEGIQAEIAKEEVDVLIALYPVRMEEVIEISDRGETMPPKSTWVEPKLRSGLTIYSLKKH